MYILCISVNKRVLARGSVGGRHEISTGRCSQKGIVFLKSVFWNDSAIVFNGSWFAFGTVLGTQSQEKLNKLWSGNTSPYLQRCFCDS